MNEMTEHRIRERAYGLWEKEGSPAGRDGEFWERARLLVEAEEVPAPQTPLQQRSASEQAEDKALEATFPASDPPAFVRASRGRKAKAK